jgi:hypothetical protein
MIDTAKIRQQKAIGGPPICIVGGSPVFWDRPGEYERVMSRPRRPSK